MTSGAGAGFEPEVAVLTPSVNTCTTGISESQVLRVYEATGVSSGELCTGYAPGNLFDGTRTEPAFG